MTLNPYAPGAGTTPPELAGREDQLALLLSTAERTEAGREPNPLICIGLRGMGKTVLLREVVDVLRERGWLAGYAEARRDVEPGVAIAHIIGEGSRLLRGGKRLRRRVRGFARSIGRARLEVSTAGVVSVEVERDGGESDLFSDLVRLLQDLGEAAREDGVGVALVLDELQTLKRADQTTLIQALASVRSLPIVLIGAGLPYLPEVLASANTYAERFRYELIDRLRVSDVEDALVVPAKREGVRWSKAAVQRVVQASNGYPYFVQLYASETWEVASPGRDGEISLDHVEKAEDRVHRQLDVGFYAARYDRTTPAEREYVDAMARLINEDRDRDATESWMAFDPIYAANERVRSGDVARALGRPISALGPVRDRLLRKGIIHSPQQGTLEFSTPGFADYVRRRVEAAGP